MEAMKVVSIIDAEAWFDVTPSWWAYGSGSGHLYGDAVDALVGTNKAVAGIRLTVKKLEVGLVILREDTALTLETKHALLKAAVERLDGEPPP